MVTAMLTLHIVGEEDDKNGESGEEQASVHPYFS